MKAARNTTGIPEVIPPKMPPWLLVRVTTRPSFTEKGSLFSEPRSPLPRNPLPNSIPFTAGMPNTAAATRFSTPPNKGSPSPAGSPVTAHSTTPPTESPSRRAASMAPRIASPASRFSTGNGSRVKSEFILSGSQSGNGSSAIPATSAMCAPTRTPRDPRYCSASPPATQSAAVSRPEKCPPPRASSAPPNFTRAV